MYVENVLDVWYAAGRRLTPGHHDELAVLQCAY